jgi:hypothetical protein
MTDPHAMENACYDLGDLAQRVTFEIDPYLASKNAHAIAILTEWLFSLTDAIFLITKTFMRSVSTSILLANRH